MAAEARAGLTFGAELSVHPLCVRLRPGRFPDAGGREGGCTDDRAGGSESVTVAGRVERARVARAFRVEYSAPGTRAGTMPRCSVNRELFGNSIWHSGSGLPGGTVTVAVTADSGVVRVEVADRSGSGCRSCVLLSMMRTAAGGWGWGWWRAWPRGGAGGGATGGR